jgi:hypothetical protein
VVTVLQSGAGGSPKFIREIQFRRSRVDRHLPAAYETKPRTGQSKKTDLRSFRNSVAQKFGLAYVLPEDLRKIYLQFGIDVPKHNGDNSWTLPLASRFIIDQEGVIQYTAVDVDYTIRPDPEHTIEVLKSIKK